MSNRPNSTLVRIDDAHMALLEDLRIKMLDFVEKDHQRRGKLTKPKVSKADALRSCIEFTARAEDTDTLVLPTGVLLETIRRECAFFAAAALEQAGAKVTVARNPDNGEVTLTVDGETIDLEREVVRLQSAMEQASRDGFMQ